MAPTKARTIALFDVDGTLTVPRKEASAETLAFLQELRKVRRSRSAAGRRGPGIGWLAGWRAECCCKRGVVAVLLSLDPGSPHAPPIAARAHTVDAHAHTRQGG